MIAMMKLCVSFVHDSPSSQNMFLGLRTPQICASIDSEIYAGMWLVCVLVSHAIIAPSLSSCYCNYFYLFSDLFESEGALFLAVDVCLSV